jgi:hypothetical protein
MIDRKTLLAMIAAIAVGYWLAGSSSSTPPAQDRPVLRWVAKAAKFFLWVSLVAEQPPAQGAERQLVHAPPIGDDGYQVLDNGKGW